MTDPPWATPLLAPAQPMVHAIGKRVPGFSLSVPRAGLGAVFVHGVHTGLAGRRWNEAGRVAASALETWNCRVHGDPAGDRILGLEADLAPVRKLWAVLRKRADARLRAVVDRVVVLEAADLPIPEPVLFFRAAAAAGLVTAEADDALHAALDRAATWTGLALSPRAGEAERAGALAGARLEDEGVSALEAARRAVAELPQSDFAERWLDALARVNQHDLVPARFPGWRPALLPLTAPRLARPALPPADEWEAEARRWSGPIADAMTELVPPAGALGRAASMVAHRGGKRLRPMLCLAACEAAGGAPEAALAGAACVEWLHEASLLLDDIVDEAPVRRGVPALHTLAGVPFAAGVAGGVLAQVERASRGLPEPSRAVLADAASALVEGQQEELRRAGSPELDEAACYRIMEAKTARLFAAAARLGAHAAGATPRIERALAEFATEIGLAFQLVDDLLDGVGHVEVLGKAPGADFAARRPTWPLLLLRPRLTAAERAKVDAWLQAGHRPEGAELAWLREALAASGVSAEVLARAAQHRARAEAALARLPEGRGRDRLGWLAARLVERQT